MSDGAAQNGGTQAAAAGEAAAAVPAAVTATAAAAAASVANGAVAATPVPAAPVAAAPMPPAAPVANPVHVVVAAPAAVAVAAPAPAHHKDEADCKPKKVASKDGDKALPDDADQNLAQPADGCVLPADGQAAAPAPAQEAAPVVVDDGEGGGISSGLLIGAGVLAAIGVGVLALSGDKDKNGAPVANPDTGAVNEGASLTGSVATNDSDPDNDTLTYTLTGTAPAGLTLSSNGSYTFDANNAAYNGLAAGQTQVVTANYSVADPDGATATSTLTITVTGTNDAPVAVADTAAATEGGAVVTGNVATNDTDPDQGQTATLTYTLNAPVAGLTLNTNGTYSFDPTNAAYNSLGAGQTQQVVANYTVKDATGATSTSTLTITVTGTNDAPVAVADVAAVNEDATVTGNLRTNDTDADANAALTYSVVGTAPAGFTLNADGTYSFNAANAAYQGLAAGQTQNVVVNYQVSDGTATATSTLTITVTGVNDAPVAVADANAGVEDTQITGNVGTNDTDVDTPAANLTYTVVGTAPAGFTLNSNGTYTLDTTNAAYQPLAAGQTQNVVVNYQVSDGTATSQSTLTIVVTGAADGPVVVAASLDRDNDSNLTTPFLIPENAGTATYAFTDDIAIANNVRVNNFGGDDTLSINATQGQVSFASGDFDGDLSPDDLRITVNNGGTVSDIVLTNSVDPSAVVIDYATAEAAIGAGTTNFTFTGVVAPPPPAGTTSSNLDVDTDNNLNTYRVFDAGTDGFLFTDVATTANSVEIINFGATDRIILDDGNLYSFALVARDGDNIANDIRITLNVGGTVSDIFIKDVADPNGFISNEAQAELALNTKFGTTGVDYFQFA